MYKITTEPSLTSITSKLSTVINIHRISGEKNLLGLFFSFPVLKYRCESNIFFCCWPILMFLFCLERDIKLLKIFCIELKNTRYYQLFKTPRVCCHTGTTKWQTDSRNISAGDNFSNATFSPAILFSSTRRSARTIDYHFTSLLFCGLFRFLYSRVRNNYWASAPSFVKSGGWGQSSRTSLLLSI